VNWFRHDAFGSHVGERLALAMVILLSFALGIALSNLSSGSLHTNATQTKARTKARRSIGAYAEDKTGPYRMENAGVNLDEPAKLNLLDLQSGHTRLLEAEFEDGRRLLTLTRFACLRVCAGAPASFTHVT
jgi:hypothetical protein